MLENQSYDDLVKNLEKKMKEMEQQELARKREMTALLEKLQVTAEELGQFYNDPKKFSPEEWEELKKQKKAFDAKLNSELENIRDPLKANKNRASLNIPSYAIYVR